MVPGLLADPVDAMGVGRHQASPIAGGSQDGLPVLQVQRRHAAGMAGAGPQRRALDGRSPRWHWQHGPIDLILGADGEPAAVAAALAEGWARFEGLLAELVRELPLLKAALAVDGPAGRIPVGPVARRMWQACHPLAPLGFLTPMAAVAGAVAEAVIAAFERPGIRRAWVNNGGDVALHLAPGERLRIGVAEDLPTPAGRAQVAAGFTLRAEDPVRGLATSGWGGRSFSLGIADRVTVLAARAAEADALATVVANAVDLDHPGILRQPACDLRDDSDLGDRRVTVAVPPLPPALCDEALSRGLALARRLQVDGRLEAALLNCQGRTLRLDPLPRRGLP